jgi:hypothetical protein
MTSSTTLHLTSTRRTGALEIPSGDRREPLVQALTDYLAIGVR